MNASLRILNKGIVAEYFKQNLFFILIVLLLAFGFLSGAEHKQLVLIAATQPSFLYYILVLWIFYFVFNVYFAWRTLSKTDFHLFFNIVQFRPVKAFLLMTYTYFMCSPLSIYYGFFMIYMGLAGGYTRMPLVVFMFHVLATLIGGGLYYYRIKISQERASIFDFRWPYIKNLRTPFSMFFIRELIQSRPVMVLMVKLFSFFLKVKTRLFNCF